MSDTLKLHIPELFDTDQQSLKAEIAWNSIMVDVYRVETEYLSM